MRERTFMKSALRGLGTAAILAGAAYGGLVLYNRWKYGSAKASADLGKDSLLDRFQRLDGVGSVEFFGSRYAMRVWLDPGKLRTYSLTPADVVGATLAVS